MNRCADLSAEELTAVLVDVLGAVAREEAAGARGGAPDDVQVAARLAIRDGERCAWTVEVRVGAPLARVLAGRMLNVADPVPDDVLDAVAEIGNIAGGNVKTLLCEHGRLSLPSARVVEHAAPPDHDGVRVRAVVLGHVAELVLTAGGAMDDLHWPPDAPHDDAR